MAMYTVMFWTLASEALAIGYTSQFEFNTFEEAYNAAETLMEAMHKRGAVSVTIRGGETTKEYDIED